MSGRGGGRDIVVVYEFSLNNDGPYTGSSSSPGWFDPPEMTSISEKLRAGQPVAVRYRPDDPSVNTLDPTFWQELEGFRF
jgi:hypothetical protein